VAPDGVSRALGVLVAPFARDAARAACHRWPFLPVKAMRMTCESAGPEPRRRGFHDPAVVRRAVERSREPEVLARKSVSQTMAMAKRKQKDATRKPLTLGQRKWRDNMRRRKHASLRPVVTRDEG
jgi:hypothetical protein